MKFEIDDIILSVDVVSPLGIIINELISNSMKYAFTGMDDGIITVKAHIIENHVSLTYEDNGPGIPESITFENSTGFGMTLISMLVKQIYGSIAIERDKGTRFVIKFDV